MKALSKLSALMGAVALAGWLAPTTANAAITYDLQTTSGGKTVSNVAAGDTVDLKLFAIITGSDATTLNEGFVSGFWNIISTASGLNGALTNSGAGLGTASNFQASGFQQGAIADLNGDGNMDIGSTNSGSTTNWASARSATAPSPQLMTVEGQTAMLLGTYRYTVGAGSGSTSVNVTGITDGSLFVGYQYQVDGAAVIAATGTKVTAGGAVVISSSGGGPGPTVGPGSAAVGTSVGTETAVPISGGYTGNPVTFTATNAGSLQVNGMGDVPAFFVLFHVNGFNATQLNGASGANLSGGTALDLSTATGFDLTLLQANPWANLLVKYPTAVSDANNNFVNFNFQNLGTADEILAVPEPASLGLMGLAAASLMLRRRKAK